ASVGARCGGVRRTRTRTRRGTDRSAAARACRFSFRAMSDDRAADIFRHLDEPVRERLFAQLDLETKASVARLLAYPENTSGSIMTTEFVSVPSTWTVGETLDYVR